MVCLRNICINTLHKGDNDNDDDDDDDDNNDDNNNNNNNITINNRANAGTSDIGTINSNDRTDETLYSSRNAIRNKMWQ